MFKNLTFGIKSVLKDAYEEINLSKNKKPDLITDIN